MNHRERLVSGKAFIRSPELLAGFRSAWRGDPPNYDAIRDRSHGDRYEIGRQLAVWMKASGMTTQKCPAPTLASLRGMARQTGFPVIIGVNR
jgi:hypothetical protein